MKKTKKRRKLNIKKTIRSLFCLLLIIGFISACIWFSKNIFVGSKVMYIASDRDKVSIYDKELKEIATVIRGEKVKIKGNKYIKDEKNKYMEMKKDNKTVYINEDNLVDSEKKVVLEKKIYVRTPCSILKGLNNNEIVGLANKGKELKILDYDKLNSNGIVNVYKIKLDDVEGYVYGKYLTVSESDAKLNYNAETNDPIHSRIKNTYNGGNAINLDFYPVDKPKFKDNVMPESVYSLYLNNGKNIISNVDKYIEFAEDTKINAFVIDIKDSGSVGYKSSVMEELSPTSNKYANNSLESYKSAVKKLKDAGFYVIGRITAFKDDYYVKDHPENSIRSKSDNKPYLHQSSYWPTPYSRDVWYYNVELAKEAIKEIGFNEINFDYVRFPDKMTSIDASGSVELGNIYGEEKAQAIQRFLQYATDEIHKLNAYVSVDVFGESTNGNYMTAYGQYWPAISNVADVISGMPYPDHFSKGYYNISEPWNHPYELMTAWAKDASKRQAETTSKAVVRTWIQAFNARPANGIDYNAKQIEEQVTALFEQGLKGGYITWLSSSNLEKYQVQKKAFQINYLKEVK